MNFSKEIEHLMTSRDVIKGAIIVVVVVIAIELSNSERIIRARKDNLNSTHSIASESTGVFVVTFMTFSSMSLLSSSDV